MVRGHAKADAQAKNQKKMEAAKKNGTQRGAADKAMVIQCSICKVSMPTCKQLKDHYDSRHSNLPFPAEYAAMLAPAGAAEEQEPAQAKPVPKKKKKKAPAEGLDDLLSAGLAGAGKKKGK
mmetsp:Transcript_26748/g.46749  ORF Transcript_26748/g.46749 Transcript_26748/m.46749 type:complete len:121 (+) Transcript_26748:82-444(+)|eukprot:CAMPEP_0205911780 /NCGR_PEP_ID=MMETSP1325-20131115/5384_1 /ASSEMBLY_ACC=CAM_ASM_000708 /TAXON_ID=236786 /ORGANISM="Florenciella sp., Strain RCC1007" /LENGTH=120 /DNA_ID=CAMNT_0053278365 /DNA_START=41 /DNA_END=403 /DNA_ORIENTATION=+